jgi:hypothetical protein
LAMQQAELTERYVIMTRAADNGALDGANELPHSHATQQSTTELNIHNIAQGHLDELGAEQKGAIQVDESKITTQVAAIPFTVRRSPAEFQLRAEALIQEAGHELINLYEAKLKKERNYRLFKVYHGLRRDAEPVRSLWEAWSYLFLMLMLDGSLNAYFFKDVGTLGLAEGFFIAVVMAGCNIALGFVMGWGPLRYFGHRYKLHLLWAVPVFLALVVAIGAFNWCVANYREIAQVNSDGTLADTLNRARTFSILGFPSYLMGLVGIVIATYAATRAYVMYDSYPWYGWVHKRMKEADDEFLEKFAPTKDKIQKAGETFLGEAREDYQAWSEAAHELLSACDRIANRIDEYHAQARIIDAGCNAALRAYREANMQVRGTPAPAYFGTPTLLRRREDLKDNREILLQRKGLQDRFDKLRRSYEDLENEIPAIKLALLSEASMNQRLDGIVQKGGARQADKEIQEENERMLAA